jgi:protein TonB
VTRRLPPRTLGWLAAGVSATAILSGAAALALTAQRPPEPAFALDLALAPAAAPAVAAVTDPAPQVVDEAPAQDSAAPAPEAAPPVPKAETAPDLPRTEALSAPVPEVPAVADLALPPPPEEPVKKKVAKAEPAPEKKASKAEDPARKKTAEAKPETKAAKPATAAATASAMGAKASGGVSPAAYAKAVMKKVRATRKQRGAGRGAVVVGFSIAGSGGLASVQVIRSSGNAALDAVALDHIRRSAPFPPPPEGAGRSFSFEFVGK